jgi:hypothetical protein
LSRFALALDAWNRAAWDYLQQPSSLYLHWREQRLWAELQAVTR